MVTFAHKYLKDYFVSISCRAVQEQVKFFPQQTYPPQAGWKTIHPGDHSESEERR